MPTSSDKPNLSLLPYFYAALLIIVAAALRRWPLGILEQTIPWVTFYPAVMVSGILGGFGAGIFATVATCLTVLYAWPILVPAPFIHTTSDWLGMAVFFANCALISGITEATRQANKRAQKARDSAEQANRAKSVFLANMSHELRTPLIGILGFSRLLAQSDRLSEEQVSKLQIITRSGEHLLELINGILDLSKVESGCLILEESVTDLGSLLRDVSSSIEGIAHGKGLVFHFEPAPDLPTVILVDGTRLRQILLNLLGNAVKFTPNGTVTLRVSRTLPEAPGDSRLQFDVLDSGPGIPESERERVFEPFVQLGQQNSGNPGTGLGLSICRQYATLMRGNLSLKANPGGGSIFSLNIPLATTNINPPPPSGKPENALQEIVPGQPTRRLLIAEDNPDNRLLLRTLLDPLGFEICEVTDGQTAVERCQTWQPDLIWMDIRMPTMSGTEATLLIRKLASIRQPKIIALTAHALEEERLQILASGCDEVIRKPYTQGDIYNALNRHLGIRFQDKASPAPSPTIHETLSAAFFDGLPAGAIADLHRAAEELNAEHCLSAISRIPGLDAPRAEVLRRKIKNHQYAELLGALDDLNGSVAR